MLSLYVINVFDQLVKYYLRTYNNIGKNAPSQGGDYTTCLLDYNSFNEQYKVIAIDLSKQQAPDAEPKLIKKVKFTGNLNRGDDVNHNATIFFIIQEAKDNILDFSQGTAKLL